VSRRRVDIPKPTARLVLARSGGYCANPSCHRDLFPPVGSEGKVATVAKLAHIIGQSRRGPRGSDPLPLKARNDASNIILLCSVCHDLVDDMNATDAFTIERLQEWKREHERRVRHGAAIPKFETREELNSVVAPLLARNEGIWRNLGPESPAAEDIAGESADVWRDRVLNEILPTNRRILELVDANRDLLAKDELALLEDFRVHAGALELNYTKERTANAPRFPRDFPKLFGP
jgi:hypothetical protein